MAVTADYQFELNGYTFGLATNTSLTEVSGLDMPEVDFSTQNSGNQHGSTTNGLYLKERVIALTGRINGTYDTMPTLRDALKRAFRPQAADVQFVFRLPGYGGTNLTIGVKPQNLRGSFRGVDPVVGLWDWMGTLVAGDPRIYAVATQSVTPVLNGAAATATNGGNFEAPTTITFTGPLTNPAITNSTTGKTFRLLITLTAGQVVTVKSLDTTVYQGSTSKYGTIDPAARSFIELAPGANSLTLTASSGSGNASVQWRNTWI